MTIMELLYRGKTKDVYRLDDERALLRFKDDVTGVDGVFDPGANSVALSIDGMGRANLAMSARYFKLLEEGGVRTHFIDADQEAGTMTVRMARPFGRGLEVICRRRAVGSFIRRYGTYIEPGAPLDDYVEFTLKDDERGDPLITREGLAALDILSGDQYELIAARTRETTGLIADDLALLGLELYDIKLEFGVAGGEVLLMDEVSAGNMRVMEDGRQVEPMDLSRRVTEGRS